MLINNIKYSAISFKVTHQVVLIQLMVKVLVNLIYKYAAVWKQ